MLPFTLPPGDGYVIALSGGADSRLLLELTVRAVLSRGREPRDCVRAAHMNHGIRGEEADRDEAFCRRECARLGIPLSVAHADIPALARESGQSMETEAREARYAFLLCVMREAGYPSLLTAHNADDQLETLLHHLLRGSGTRGMIGIPAARPLGETLSDGTPLTVYRPLLGWSRREVLEAVGELGLTYVTDSTNLTDDCVRNRLRHHAVPVLEELSVPGAPQAAAVRLGQAAGEDEEALTAMAADRYRQAGTPGGLPTAAVAAEPVAVAKRMILLAYADRIGAAPPPGLAAGLSAGLPAGLQAGRTLAAYHVEDILALCRRGEEGAVSDPLPGHMRAEVRAGRLVFASCTPSEPPRHPLRSLGEGLTVWEDAAPCITVEVSVTDSPCPAPTDETVFASACFPATLAACLAARGRVAGDVILSHGMTKKLKKLICDKHIPLDLRDRLPLVCLPDGTPLWFPGVAFRDGFPPPTEGLATRVTVRILRDRISENLR